MWGFSQVSVATVRIDEIERGEGGMGARVTVAIGEGGRQAVEKSLGKRVSRVVTQGVAEKSGRGGGGEGNIDPQGKKSSGRKVRGNILAEVAG